jgi:hypothetical protein
LSEMAALNGVRIELEQRLYLFSGHREIVNEPLKSMYEGSGLHRLMVQRLPGGEAISRYTRD